MTEKTKFLSKAMVGAKTRVNLRMGDLRRLKA